MTSTATISAARPGVEIKVGYRWMQLILGGEASMIMIPWIKPIEGPLVHRLVKVPARHATLVGPQLVAPNYPP